MTKPERPNKQKSSAPGPDKLDERVAKALASFKFRSNAPGIKVTKKNGKYEITLDSDDREVALIGLMTVIGTNDIDFYNGMLQQLLDAATDSDGTVREDKVNFMLSVIKAFRPRDQIEAMLLAQMAAVHTSAMTFARNLATAENLPQQDSADRVFNKTTRTFLGQVEALQRYRTGGEQKVTVQNVSVGEGGQAIVGNVTHSPHAKAALKKPAAPLTLTDDTTKQEIMPILDSTKQSVAVPARKRWSKKNDE